MPLRIVNILRPCRIISRMQEPRFLITDLFFKFDLTDSYNQVATLIRQSDPLPPFYQTHFMCTPEEAGLSKRASIDAAMVARDTEDVPQNYLKRSTKIKVGEIMVKIGVKIMVKVAIPTTVVPRIAIRIAGIPVVVVVGTTIMMAETSTVVAVAAVWQGMQSWLGSKGTLPLLLIRAQGVGPRALGLASFSISHLCLAQTNFLLINFGPASVLGPRPPITRICYCSSPSSSWCKLNRH